MYVRFEDGLKAQREVSELLAEQISGDERAMFLLDQLLEVQFGLIKIFNEELREAIARAKDERPK
jgi:hypothetical protein